MNLFAVFCFLLVWVFVAATMEYHAYYIKKNQRWRWARRQEGLLSFSNKQLQFMRWIWPITLAGMASFIVLAWIFLSIAWCVDKFNKTS